MFEKATKLKLRFKLANGLATTEDLWDLNLIDLNKLAQSLNRELKNSEEESFIVVKSSANNGIELQFQVVKHIIAVKLEEKKLKIEKNIKNDKKEQILNIINQKEYDEMQYKTISELKAELDSL